MRGKKRLTVGNYMVVWSVGPCFQLVGETAFRKAAGHRDDVSRPNICFYICVHMQGGNRVGVQCISLFCLKIVYMTKVCDYFVHVIWWCDGLFWLQAFYNRAQPQAFFSKGFVHGVHCSA